MISPTLNAALAYASRGWAVFPLKSGGKSPLTPNGHFDASCDTEQIKTWWVETPDANIGIALKPSGLVVLDVDVGPGKDGYESLKALHDEVTLPGTMTALTPSGGMHAVYSRPEGCPVKRKINFYDGGSGLDLLGDGYIVAAPSTVGGKPYVWQKHQAIVELPDALVQVYTTKKQVERKISEGEIVVAEGGRDNALFRLGCALRDTGIGEEAVHVALLSENQKRCNPPMEGYEVARIVQSVMGRVVPSRDVLADVAFIDTILPGASEDSGTLKPAEGRLSVTLEEAHEHPTPPIVTHSTGFAGLDKLLGGGYPDSALTVVIGPPASGKTGFAIGQCLQSAKHGLFISTELATAEVKARVGSQVLGRPWREIMTGEIHPDEVGRAISGLNMRIVGSDLIEQASLMDLTKRLNGISKEIDAYREDFGEAPIVFIDYLQDLCRQQDERDPVGSTTMWLRRMAVHYRCPIVAVSSTSRMWYSARPDIEHAVGFLSAAKESGGVDYDAANVIFLDVANESVSGCKDARIAVAKARHGEAGFVGAKYEGVRGGRWVADAGALHSFTAEARIAKTKSAQVEKDCKAVMGRIRDYGAESVGTLQHNCGIPVTRAKAAILALQADGKIERRKVPQIGEDHRTRMVEVLGFPEIKVPDAKPTPEPESTVLPWLDEITRRS